MEKKVVINGRELIVKQGDITEETTDAIVNPANPTLMGGGGVDGLIHKKGGKAILEECKRIREEQYPDGLPTGEAVITTGGNLKAKYVIHTVGPICGDKNRGMTEREKGLLSNAYFNSLKLADERGLQSIAFPSISTGVYSCSVDDASEVALKTIVDYLKNNAKNLKKVVMVLYTPDMFKIFADKLDKIAKN